MRRIFKLSLLCLSAGAVHACAPEQIVETPNVPTAGVRFINAVPDTNQMDFRFVDLVENSAHFRIAFRNNPVTTGTGVAAVTASTLVQYKPATVGQRHFRIFLSDTLQSVASTVIKDSTLTLEEGKNYTVLLWGSARAGTMRLTVIDESVPDPGAQVALRVINATESAIDVRQYPHGGTPPAAATWANVGPLGISSYVSTAPDTIRFNVQPAGGGAVLFADARALVGESALVGPPGPFDESPGTTRRGSAVTAIIFPRSVAGSKAPQGFTTPSISFIWDRRPPRPPGT
jgi:hypothetical protein